MIINNPPHGKGGPWGFRGGGLLRESPRTPLESGTPPERAIPVSQGKARKTQICQKRNNHPQIMNPSYPPDGPHNTPADSPPDSRADSPQTAPTQPVLAPFTRNPCKLLREKAFGCFEAATRRLEVLRLLSAPPRALRKASWELRGCSTDAIEDLRGSSLRRLK